MTDPTIEERLARLQASGRASGAKQASHRRASADSQDQSSTKQRLARLRERQGVQAPTSDEPIQVFGETSRFSVDEPMEQRLSSLQSRYLPDDQQSDQHQSGPRAILTDDPYTDPDATGEVLTLFDSVSRNTRWRPQLRPIDWDWLPGWSGSRVAATGASVVSFASMIVAMGPLLAGTEDEAQAIDIESEAPVVDGGVPEAPPVDIDVAPAQAPDALVESARVDGSAVVPAPQAAPLATPPVADGAAPTTAPPAAPAPVDPNDSQAPVTAAPSTTAAAPTSAPADTAAPTAAPTTAPPATAAPGPTAAPAPTAAPTTAAPTTAAPTTAPPTTSAPTTAPPRSDGSG